MSTQTRVVKGAALGSGAAVAWAFYNIGADLGRAQGFSSADLTAIRFVVGAGVMILLARALPRKGKGATRGQLVWLVITAGPAFALLINLGFGFAPLSHAVVISPGMTMVTASVLSWAVDREPLPASRVMGIGLLFLGLLIVAAGSDTDSAKEGPAWIGDLCFVGSGTLWGVFTWLIGRWKLDSVRVTGQVATASAILFLPGYLIFSELPSLPPADWAMQAIYQGVLGGALAIVFYAATVTHLGAARAGLFPALVPPLAILFAVPLVGVVPTALELLGVGCVSLGMLVALGLIAQGSWSRAKPCKKV